MIVRRSEAALAALDHALAERPDKVHGDLAAAVRCLVALRQALTEEARRGVGSYLDRCNGILSMVIGGEYPLEGVRRERMKQARDHLALLLEELSTKRS